MALLSFVETIQSLATDCYLFAQPATTLRLMCIGLILSGIVGLKLVT
jgi:multidrug transporter EmrE-like cation transporter